MKTVKLFVLWAALALSPVAVHAQEAVHEAPAAAGEAAPAGEGHEAAAGHEGGHHSMFDQTPNAQGVSRLDSFVYAAINFVLLVVLLVYLLRKPLAQFLVDRRDGVRKALEEAKAAKDKAEKTLGEYRRRMDNLESELNTLRSEIFSAGDRERDAIVQAAKAQAEKIVADARLMGEQEVRRAKAVLREEMVKLAADLAQAKLATQVSGQERDKQLNDFISKLEAL